MGWYPICGTAIIISPLRATANLTEKWLLYLEIHFGGVNFAFLYAAAISAFSSNHRAMSGINENGGDYFLLLNSGAVR